MKKKRPDPVGFHWGCDVLPLSAQEKNDDPRKPETDGGENEPEYRAARSVNRVFLINRGMKKEKRTQKPRDSRPANDLYDDPENSLFHIVSSFRKREWESGKSNAAGDADKEMRGNSECKNSRNKIGNGETEEPRFPFFVNNCGDGSSNQKKTDADYGQT